MHHRRVVQEKNKLIADIKRLRQVKPPPALRSADAARAHCCCLPLRSTTAARTVTAAAMLLQLTRPQHYAKYEPAMEVLKKKCDDALKEKMMITLDRDRARARVRLATPPARRPSPPIAAARLPPGPPPTRAD
jgi:hypothetical protein